MEIERLREPCPKWAANEIDSLRAKLAAVDKQREDFFWDKQRAEARVAELATEIARWRKNLIYEELEARSERAEAELKEWMCCAEQRRQDRDKAEVERDVLWKALEHFVVWWDSLPSGMDDRPLELEEWVNSKRCKTVVEQARAAIAPSEEA